MFKLYQGIPSVVASFLITNFNLLGNNNYTKEFFGNFKNVNSVCIIDKTQVYAAAILNPYPVLNAAWVSFFIVDPQLKRKGLGTQLLNEIKGLLSFLQLEVWEENTIAYSFYRKNCFEEVGRDNGSVYMMWKRS